ncbi:MAG: cation diffusion facilitator family transporter [Candidatus Daviesbacteria bacterium]|nr:cation diffusion facilitator family transporter [Candidatus Daviesbacteria bacterium]
MNGYHGVSTNIKALRISALLILIYFVFEIAIALSTGSLSLLADAGHELSTFVAIAISLLAMQLATQKPTPKKTFGLLRIEILAALFNGLLLLGMAGFIIIRGIDRLQNPMEVSSLPMFIMAFGGISLEIASLWIMYKGQKENLNIRGSFWHVMNAFLGSVAVIIAAAFIQFGQIYVADAWAGILFAFILIWASFGIIKDSFFILIDVAPKEVNLISIEKELSKIPGVKKVHHFHARTLVGSIKTFSGHLVVKDMNQAGGILKKAKQILDKKHGFSLSTVQIEDENLSETDIKQLEYK